MQCTVYDIKLTTNITDKNFSLKLFWPITHLVAKYNVQCIVYHAYHSIFSVQRTHTPLLRSTDHSQTVGKLSVTSWRKEGFRMSEISARLRKFLIMILWIIHGVLVIDHGPKIQWVTFLRFSLFQNPAAMSPKFNDHFRSLKNIWKSDFL